MSEPKSITEQLWDAACQGHRDECIPLLEQGADKNAKGWRGITPLIGAAAAGYADVVRLLLDHGADTSLTDDRGFTALEAASMNDHTEIATLIRRAGGKGDATTAVARALRSAVDSGASVEVILDSRDGRGRRPWWRFWG